MYISKIKIDNFRNFNSQTVDFNEGVNVLIGHNNAGKTNLLKALSIVLNNKESKRLGVDDFNKKTTLEQLKVNPPGISIEVTISKGLDETADDLVTVANWLTKLDASYEAKLTYQFFLPEKEHENYKNAIGAIAESEENLDIAKAWKIIKHDFIRLYTSKLWGGDVKTKTLADGESLRKFDFQFLDAIRDVERDLLTGRDTLLRDVFQFFLDYDLKEHMNSQEEAEQIRLREEIKQRQEKFSQLADDTLGHLQERMKEGKKHILSYAQDTGASFNNAIPDFDGSISEVEMLSALKLIIKYSTGIEISIPATHNGLGYNNLIFMSLLLAKMQVDTNGDYMGSNAKVFSMLAIEEPEAHLHPSMQFKFLKFLKEGKNNARQVFVTSHSTHITSAVSLDEIICLHNEEGETKVGYPAKVFTDDKSKKYVQRFLDATKSDMLFAQRVLMVEGIAEQLLMSTFAKYYDIESKALFDAAQNFTPTNDVYKSKTLEDNHVAVINVSGRYFEHFLPMFDGTIVKSVPKRVVCLTDRDPDRKHKTRDTSFTKCYPFEYQQEHTNYYYKDNPTDKIAKYANNPNIRYYSQDALKGKTFEYDLVLHNPSLELLLTDSMKNIEELKDLMSYVDDPGKAVIDYLNRLPKGSNAKPNTQNVKIVKGINECNWPSDDDKIKAIIAARYLNSVGKGENALDLAYALEENLSNKGTADYMEFIVPQYIKDAIDWLCK